MRILFVCLGNICRSPLAEVIARAEAEQRGLDTWHIASAGTGDWHVGQGADRRSLAVARKHGLDLSRHVARQVTAEEMEDWDWFVAMDRSNRADLLAMGADPARVLLMRQFDPSGELDVPDPYYGGEDGFELAYRLLRENAGRLLDYLASYGR
ncbi:MAG: low molecular weight phosphotyrosine protein phosphatase [Zetaproteobacteria bacterium]|nr:MAG: low molecular weight phosphotyrosine protein phosphatase [Zetaproteobacteria bacterium]